MKILIHGCICTTNFGDALFAKLFYETLNTKNNEVDFLSAPHIGISDFFRKEIGYDKHVGFFKVLHSDVLVMMSGGYLGDDTFSLKNSIMRYIRYYFLTGVFQLLRKPVYFVGVGGGPLYSKWLQRIVANVLNKAKYISVRDKETYDYMIEYGVKNKMVITSDTALVLTSDAIDTKKLSENALTGEKYLFFHYVSKKSLEQKIAENVIPAINKFLIEHENYKVIFGCDEVKNIEDMLSSSCYKLLPEGRVILNEYIGVKQLCEVLNSVDFIITPKLHVGIVGAALNKSVISFPIHREKTERFYRQIQQGGRSLHLDKLTTEIAYDKINEYYDKPIIISEEIRNSAISNLDVLKTLCD